jgi:predicted helicase
MLNLKSSHKPIKEYYKILQELDKLGIIHELAVKGAFEDILKACCSQLNWTYIAEQTVKINNNNIRPDGMIQRQDTLKHGYWEAKGNNSDLEKAVREKSKAGYPKNNLLFWQPKRIILYQNNKLVFDEKIDNNSDNLVQAVKLFFEHSQPEIEAWDQAAIEFGDKVKELAKGLLELIATQKKTNKKFIEAFTNFTNLCKQAINPNISELAIEEMLIQHLLTERIFRRLFNNPDFVKRNIIASEIEKVIEALTSKSFNRDSFLQGVDYFYKALENTASTITDYSEKQDFLNTVYEKFFQGFAVKVADTHGIVYTPQPIVDFMVKSVEQILQKEFNKSLSDKGVHILDPFVGTGNFIMRIMKEMRKTSLSHKYQNELHCNEVMLLPYYIASMNIEHQYFTETQQYLPFEGICFVDTFEVQKHQQLSLFTAENTARVKRQQESPIYIIIGNPPYNAWQVSENDNNKNRAYKRKDKHSIEGIDDRIADTYAKASKATLKNALSDAYVKAIRWACDRIKDEGIIAFVTNNGFIDNLAFDGMRQHLEKDFSAIYVLDLGGNSRKSNNTKVSNVFDIRVGVSVNIFVKKKAKMS